MLLANEQAQHSRESAGSTRVPGSNSSVTAHHDPWLLIEGSNVVLFHRVTNNTGAAVTHNSHVSFNRSYVQLTSDLFECLEFKIRVRTTADNRYVSWATYIINATLHVLLVVVTTAGYQDSNG